MHVYFAYINYTNFSGTDEASKEVEGEKGKKKKICEKISFAYFEDRNWLQTNF